MFLKRNYDTAAWFYDGLSRLVFGRTLVDAQSFLIDAIPARSSVLIAGGGTGWILEEIAKKQPAGLHITYVDASSKMMALAKRHSCGNNTITFITSQVEDAGLAGVFDVVLTPFLFDNFSEDTMQKIFSVLDNLLAENGIWLYSDFRNTDAVAHKAILWSMYRFFGLISGVEATRLPGTEACFAKHGYRAREQKTFMNGFVTSAIYERYNTR